MRILTSIISVLLLLCSASLTTSTKPSPATTPVTKDGGATRYRVLYIKNAKPYVLVDRYDRRLHPHRQRINGGRKNTRPDTWRNRRATRRPFYVMLPKGFVPPSGSSPCHNLYPNSMNGGYADHFECRYVTKTLKP